LFEEPIYGVPLSGTTKAARRFDQEQPHNLSVNITLDVRRNHWVFWARCKYLLITLYFDEIVIIRGGMPAAATDLRFVQRANWLQASGARFPRTSPKGRLVRMSDSRQLRMGESKGGGLSLH